MSAKSSGQDPRGGRLALKSALNSSVGLLNALMAILVNLVVSPILVNMLGTTSFGVWKFCYRVLSLVSAAEGQATQALKWTITNKQSQGDTESMQRDIGSAISVWIRILPFMLVIGGAISWSAPLLMNDLDPEYFTMARVVCAILVVVLIATPMKVIPQAVMEGLNRGYEIMWLRSVELVLQGAAMVGFVWLGMRAEGPAWATLVVTIVAGVMGAILARRALPWFRARRPTPEDLKNFFGFSIWVLFWAVESRFIFASDLILIGIIASAEAVTAFSLSNYAVTAAAVLIISLVNGAMPSLGGIIGSREFGRAIRIRSEMLQLSWLLNITILGTVLVSNKTFVGLWVGSENYIGHSANLLMVIAGIQQSLLRVDSNIINVTLDIRRKVMLGLVAAVLCSGLAFYVSSIEGVPPVEGILFGLICGKLLLTFAFPMIVHGALESQFAVGPVVRMVAATTLILMVAHFVGQRVEMAGWIDLVVGTAVAVVAISGSALLLGVNGRSRAQLVGRMSQVLAQVKR